MQDTKKRFRPTISKLTFLSSRPIILYLVRYSDMSEISSNFPIAFVSRSLPPKCICLCDGSTPRQIVLRDSAGVLYMQSLGCRIIHYIDSKYYYDHVLCTSFQTTAAEISKNQSLCLHTSARNTAGWYSDRTLGLQAVSILRMNDFNLGIYTHIPFFLPEGGFLLLLSIILIPMTSSTSWSSTEFTKALRIALTTQGTYRL